MSSIRDKSFESHSNHISSTVIEEKKEEAQWSFEEEFLFFEAHTVLGNKWTRYANIIKNKPTKDLKNHFHACVIKSVRRIVNNKFDTDLKDIMRCLYACSYLKKLNDKMQDLSSFQIKKLNKKRYKYNPKVLIKNKKLSLEKIENYSLRLMKEILFEKEGIKELLLKVNSTVSQFDLDNFALIFSLFIKAKLFMNCIQIKQENLVSNPAKEMILSKFIKENSNSLFFIDQ